MIINIILCIPRFICSIMLESAVCASYIYIFRVLHHVCIEKVIQQMIEQIYERLMSALMNRFLMCIIGLRGNKYGHNKREPNFQISKISKVN